MIPHRARLWAILIVTVLDIAALVASLCGVAPELLTEIRPHIETGLATVLALLVPALADAYGVERRRRDPARPAIVDDVQRRASGGLGLVLLIFASALSAAAMGCSTGPQTPVSTTPTHLDCGDISVTIVGAVPDRDATVVAPSSTDATAGIVVSDNDCQIDRIRSSADPNTTGNEIGPVEVSPDTDVSALPGGL